MGVLVVEEGEVCVYFQDLVWLDEEDVFDIEEIVFVFKEWFVFDLGNNIVKCLRCNEGNDSGGKKLVISWRIKEDEEFVWNCNCKLL